MDSEGKDRKIKWLQDQLEILQRERSDLLDPKDIAKQLSEGFELEPDDKVIEHITQEAIRSISRLVPENKQEAVYAHAYDVSRNIAFVAVRLPVDKLKEKTDG